METIRHRYYAWAACRAVQAGSSKAKRHEFIDALESCGVVKAALTWNEVPTDRQAYDALFFAWVENVVDHVQDKYQKRVSFGIAARLVSVYLKGALLLHGEVDSPAVAHVHPPIDRLLLKALDTRFNTRLSKRFKWQKIGRAAYQELIDELRELDPDQPLWLLERHWTP